jgi:hypothetical protein
VIYRILIKLSLTGSASSWPLNTKTYYRASLILRGYAVAFLPGIPLQEDREITSESVTRGNYSMKSVLFFNFISFRRL